MGKITQQIGIRTKGIESIAMWSDCSAVQRFFFSEHKGEGECTVSKENVEKLKRGCELVLKNKHLASEILPTFDGLEYDEKYFSDIEMTLGVCEKILKNFDFEKDGLVYKVIINKREMIVDALAAIGGDEDKQIELLEWLGYKVRRVDYFKVLDEDNEVVGDSREDMAYYLDIDWLEAEEIEKMYNKLVEFGLI